MGAIIRDAMASSSSELKEGVVSLFLSLNFHFPTVLVRESCQLLHPSSQFFTDFLRSVRVGTERTRNYFPVRERAEVH